MTPGTPVISTVAVAFSTRISGPNVWISKNGNDSESPCFQSSDPLNYIYIYQVGSIEMPVLAQLKRLCKCFFVFAHVCLLLWNKFTRVFGMFCCHFVTILQKSSTNPIRSSTPKSRLSMRQMWPLGPMNRATISGAIGMKSWAAQKLHKICVFPCHNSMNSPMSPQCHRVWHENNIKIKYHNIIYYLLDDCRSGSVTSWRKEDKRSTSSWISS